MKIFNLPDLGEGLAEAEIRAWHIKVGEMVIEDQPLVAMETAKAVVDVPSPYAGKIVQLYGAVNDIIQTGSPLIGFEIAGETHDQGSVVGKLETSEAKWSEEVCTKPAVSSQKTSAKMMPAARMLAKEMQVDVSTIVPSGPDGLITAQDVKRAMTQSKDENKETLHGVRRMMADTMTKAHQTVVPVTIFDDAHFTALPEPFDLTVRLIQALVAAAKAEPALNAWFDGTRLERQCFSHVNLGLAVDTVEGLFVPVIKEAHQQSSTALRQSIDAYKIAVKERSIKMEDMQGATIILSNFGMMAGRYATPVIVPPMVAILAVGRFRQAPLIHQNNLTIGHMLPLSLTFDHRAVTGGEASRFLGTLIHQLTA